MRKILSLLLVIMLISLPITHVEAMTIQEACNQAYTEGDLKFYIKHHYIAGQTEHSAVVKSDDQLIDPKEKCHNKYHHHNQINKCITVDKIYSIQYKCVDTCGDKWEVSIKGKMGRGSLCWDEKSLWDSIRSPCDTYEYCYTFDLNTISTESLIQLFNLMVSLDQYLDRVQGTDIILKLAKNAVAGGTGIASTLITLAKTGGQIPYIGEAVLIGVGAAFAIYTLYEFANELSITDALEKQTAQKAVEIAPRW